MRVPRRPPFVGFVVQLANRIPLDFEAETKKSSRWFWGLNHQTAAASFEAKPPETIAAGFRVKPLETITTGFEDQTDEKPSEWFRGQTTHKPSTLILRLNQETCAPCLYVHGADHTQRHPTSRSSGHRVPDLCDHSRSSASGFLLLSWSSSLHSMMHMPPAHH
jgi:hypothetical protein